MTLLRIMSVLAVMQAACARDMRSMVPNATIKAPANLTHEELVYILQTRHGEIKEKPKHLTPCARAILGCCKDKIMNERCSEAHLCGAFFFDDNPCDDKFIIDALDAAKIFYDQFNKVSY